MRIRTACCSIPLPAGTYSGTSQDSLQNVENKGGRNGARRSRLSCGSICAKLATGAKLGSTTPHARRVRRRVQRDEPRRTSPARAATARSRRGLPAAQHAGRDIRPAAPGAARTPVRLLISRKLAVYDRCAGMLKGGLPGPPRILHDVRLMQLHHGAAVPRRGLIISTNTEKPIAK